jgi:hypothetical protein
MGVVGAPCDRFFQVFETQDTAQTTQTWNGTVAPFVRPYSAPR